MIIKLDKKKIRKGNLYKKMLYICNPFQTQNFVAETPP